MSWGGTRHCLARQLAILMWAGRNRSLASTVAGFRRQRTDLSKTMRCSRLDQVNIGYDRWIVGRLAESDVRYSLKAADHEV